MTEGLLMKLSDVKRVLNVSRKVVRRLAAQGEIRAVPVGGQMMYERRSVEGWLEQRGVRKN